MISEFLSAGSSHLVTDNGTCEEIVDVEQNREKREGGRGGEREQKTQTHKGGEPG